MFFSFLLAYVAWLQLNDPDPFFWVTLYLICASIPLFSLFKNSHKYLSILTVIATIFCFIALVLTYQGMLEYLLLHINNESLVNDMSPDKPYIEEGREFIGTLMALIIILSYWLLSRKQQLKNQFNNLANQ